MNQTAIYIAPENCLQEIGQMAQPEIMLKNDLYSSDYHPEVAEYNAHLATLRKIPCDPSCKGLWADGQKLVVGKDYEVRNNDYLPPSAIEEMLIAFPPVPKKSEDEYWEDVVIKLENQLKSGVKLKDIVYGFKKSYSLKKR